MFSMVRRDILARYRGSLGDAAWAILNPALLMATYYFVFGIVLGARRSLPSLLASMLPWLAFSEAVGRAPSVILEHRTFVKKLMFPVETLPANLVLSALVTEIGALAVFAVMMFAMRMPVREALMWLPVLLVAQVLITSGVCWFLAAAGVFVRDLGQITGFVLTLLFFLTPICYPESAVPAGAARILAWNPMWWLVDGYRSILLEGRSPQWLRLLTTGIALATGGFAWFRRLRGSFPDVL